MDSTSSLITLPPSLTRAGEKYLLERVYERRYHYDCKMLSGRLTVAQEAPHRIAGLGAFAQPVLHTLVF